MMRVAHDEFILTVFASSLCSVAHDDFILTVFASSLCSVAHDEFIFNGICELMNTNKINLS